MRIVSRYLLIQCASASAAVLLGLLAIWVAADSLVHLDDIAAEGRQRLLQILFRALDVIPLGVPVACVAGVVWSLTRAVRHREVTAIRCGGIPLRRALTPILIASLAVAGALAFVEDRLVVPARERAGDLERGLEGGSGNRPTLENGRWWYASGGSVVSAGSYDSERQVLIDVSLFEFDEEGRLLSRIHAAEAGFLSERTWELRQARILDFTSGGVAPRTAESVRLDLGLSETDMQRAMPEIEATSLHKLARRIREHRGDLTRRAALEAAFWGRVAQPLSVLILVLLAIPFAIGDVERGDSLARALLTSLGIAALYWVAWSFALAGGRSGAVPPALPVWAVTGAFLGVGAWRFRALKE